jgi:hypothetical protein
MLGWLEEMVGSEDPLAEAARGGGWAIGMGSFVQGVLENLDAAMRNEIFWKTFTRRNGGAARMLPMMKRVLEERGGRRRPRARRRR